MSRPGLTMERKGIMKAAILAEQHRPLIIAEVTLPALNVGQILVKIAWSGICGKQLEEINGRRGPDPYLPHLLGHEAGGAVVEIGPGVRKVKPGDHVVLHARRGSGIEAESPVYDWQGRRVNAGGITTFGAYSIISENRLTPIPHDVPLDVAALLGCAVTTGLGIVYNNLQLKPGQSIAVFGVGGVGLNVIQGAALVNAHPIVAIDVRADKLAQAERFGATHALDAFRSDLRDALLKLIGPARFDAAVDATGLAAVRELAYEMTGDKGTMILGGVPHYADRLTIDALPLSFGKRRTGSYAGETNPDVEIPRYLRLYALGKLKLDEQISHRYPLERINEAIETVRSGQALRCLVSMQETSW